MHYYKPIVKHKTIDKEAISGLKSRFFCSGHKRISPTHCKPFPSFRSIQHLFAQLLESHEQLMTEKNIGLMINICKNFRKTLLIRQNSKIQEL